MEVLESGEPNLLHWDRKLSELSEPVDSDALLYSTHFTELLDEFSQDVLGQLLNDPFMSDKNEMMEVELSPASPAPLIQAEHSYSLCGDSRPQSPLTHISADDNFNEGTVSLNVGVTVGMLHTGSGTQGPRNVNQADLENDDWCLGSELSSATIKTEPVVADTPGLAPSVSLTATPSPTNLEVEEPQLQDDSMTKPLSHNILPEIKLEPHEVDQFLNLSSKEGACIGKLHLERSWHSIAVDTLHMPPTPPSSHGSDSEGGQSPARSLPPSSPTQLQATVKVTSRTASALTNSPLLTAPHKLQGTGPLILTEEEKRTLIAEGYPIPTKLPLTKAEEKALKKIRRKIKNKISAQESRRKKKEYMDSLEKRVESCSNENSELRKKVEVLENTNRTLLQQLQRLQAMVAGKVSRSCKAASTQTGTCLMVVVLCFAVIFGSFSQSYGPTSSITKTVLPSQHSMPESYTASIVRSRSLLTYEGPPHPLEEQPFSDRSNGWDRHLDASKHSALSLEPVSRSQHDQVTEITIANETRLEKSVLVELQQHRVNSELDANETLKIVEIDRRVNATS